MKKIYIIGSPSSGKSFLAKKLSLKYNIKHYELDNIIYDKETKRSEKEITKLFNNIINKDSWIIEDVGREIFIDGIKSSDIVYFLNINKFILYKRCILRWLKQIFNIEHSNYKQTFKTLKMNLKWCLKYDIDTKIKMIENNTKNYKILTKKDIEKL